MADFYLDKLEDAFFDDAEFRFNKCADILDSTGSLHSEREFPQSGSSQYLYHKLNFKNKDYDFGKKHKIHKKKEDGKRGKTILDFTVIRPFRYEKIYENGTTVIFEYIEIHTEDDIYAYLYEANMDDHSINQFLDRSIFTASKVFKSLRITTAIPMETFYKRLSSSWKIEDVKAHSRGNPASIEDFELIYADPNAKFLLSYLAYSILACCEKELQKLSIPRKTRTDIPFLLAVYHEYKKESKSDAEKYHILSNYLNNIHRACYLPYGESADDYMPDPKEYESYINHPSRAKNVTLIKTNKFSMSDALPAFAHTIEYASMQNIFYPYTSLPFIIAQRDEDLPQKYFLKFKADDIDTGDAVFEKLPDVLNALTRIVQASCVYLGRYRWPSPEIQTLNRDLMNRHLFFDTKSERANDLIFLVRIIIYAIDAIFSPLSILRNAEDKKRINRLIDGIFPTMLQDFNMSVEEAAKREKAKVSDKAESITRLLQCIVEDFERGDVFTHDRPRSDTALSEIQYAFQQEDFLCFTHENNKRNVSNTFAGYLTDKKLLAEGSNEGEVWGELLKQEYQDFIERNKDGKFHKFKIPEGGSFDTYAFNIPALKAYLAKRKTS